MKGGNILNVSKRVGFSCCPHNKMINLLKYYCYFFANCSCWHLLKKHSLHPIQNKCELGTDPTLTLNPLFTLCLVLSTFSYSITGLSV